MSDQTTGVHDVSTADLMKQMVGKTIIASSCATVGDDRLIFSLSDGSFCVFYHNYDCCESVEIVDICGDLIDLIGTPLLHAEEVTNEDDNTTDPFTGEFCEGPKYDCQTWTFYKFATINGSVTLRWLGVSNGYYGEQVDIDVYDRVEDIPNHYLTDCPLVISARQKPVSVR